MIGSRIYPRFVESRLVEALTDTPVVLIHGPRQCGKTTLAKMVGEPRRYSYFNFDDPVTRQAAELDPVGFAADLPERTILDEVHRVPSIFGALKTVVDRHRVPGRFIITGSANVLRVPGLADSLAGRMEILRLHPLAQCELEAGRSGFLTSLFGKGFKTQRYERLGTRLVERLVAGGFPAALARKTPHRRAAWYRDYVEALVQRDVPDLARISALDALPRLLALVATQTASLLNVTELAGPFQLSRPTIRDYVTLLEQVFLVEELPSWHTNRLSRLLKSPKVHIGDTGLACALLRLDVEALTQDRTTFGRLLESFVYQELRRQASWDDAAISFYHLRNKDGYEVDIVLDGGARHVVGIEVKAASTVSNSDFRGLRKLRDAAGARFASGVVLYDGESSGSFGDQMYAVPIRALWEMA